ncbi:hypothetical protein ACLOJK_025522 [Asimina triloba]
MASNLINATHHLVLFMIVTLLASHTCIQVALAAGECGKTPVNQAAASLTPCIGASKNPNAKVPPACCTRVAALIQTSPRCLCAVILSPLAKQAGINPATAITVPKRCNIKNRQAGKKCGQLTEPTRIWDPNITAQWPKIHRILSSGPIVQP